MLCAEVCSLIEGLYTDGTSFRRGQIGTPIYCYALRWKRVRSVLGTPVADVPEADGIVQRAVNAPEQMHTVVTPG